MGVLAWRIGFCLVERNSLVYRALDGMGEGRNGNNSNLRRIRW